MTTKIAFPKIMGILNVTPDSFSDGGRHYTSDKAIDKALELIDLGADILDIGGESTRPGAMPVPEAEELRRVIPVIKAVRKLRNDCTISIDTVKFEVAKRAIDAGASIINDISGLKYDARLAQLAADSGADLILMHIQGEPRTMQLSPVYSNVVNDVINELKAQINLAESFGVKKIYADPGIGFGKTYEHNISLLKNLIKFKELNVPLVLGISRKSFIGKMLGIELPAERDTAGALIHSLLLSGEADIIRVHNVLLYKQLQRIYKELN